jgi:type II secretory pathway pseudopilin PulG
MTTRERRPSEAGMSMVALFAAMSIMFIMMGAAVPAWRYVMKDAREEELLFRGDQIVRGLQCYQEKVKGPAVNLEVMVQQKCLRKVYKDPFAKDGKWRFIRAGEVALPPGVPGLGGGVGGLTPATTLAPQPAGTTRDGQPQLGGTGFIGVASFSKEKSLRIMNGRTRYNEWRFVLNEPRRMGRNTGVVPSSPGVTPTPPPAGPGIRRPEQK